MRAATLASARHDRRRCRLGSAIATSSMQCATPSRRAQQAKTDLTRFDRLKNLNMGSFHIHLRGFFSSITAQVAAAVIPLSATSSKTSSEFLSESFSRTIASLDALIVSQSTNHPIGCPKNAGRCPKKNAMHPLILNATSQAGDQWRSDAGRAAHPSATKSNYENLRRMPSKAGIRYP